MLKLISKLEGLTAKGPEQEMDGMKLHTWVLLQASSRDYIKPYEQLSGQQRSSARQPNKAED